MPSWVAELGQLLLGVAALLFGLGFLTIVWKTAWALRGWVETEKSRAKINQELVEMVREFIKMQVQTNETIATGLRTMARRVRDLEEDKQVNA